MRKPTPYGMTLNLIIIARFISEVVIQIAIELICMVQYLPKKYCTTNLVILSQSIKGLS